MSVSKNKTTGKWECRYYVRSADGSLKSAHKRGFSTKQEAQAYELAHRHDSEPSDGDSFGTMFESLALHNRASEVTTAQRRARMHKYCKDLLGKSMRSLTKQDFLLWRESLSEWDIATQTKNDIIGYVKQVGRYAWETYDIPDQSKVLKPFPKELDDFHEMVLITPAQFAEFLSHETNPILSAFYQFLFMTGCRKGEAKALLKSDYDPIRKRVHIYKSMRRGEGSLRTTKTRNERWVALDDATNEKITALCKRNGEWLFGDEAPLDNNTITWHFKKNLQAAGLPDMRIHDLRHSHVSMLWDAGVPVPSISKRIGHSSPKVTMECYSHIFDKEEEKTLNFLNNLHGI
jgi:integrase